MRYRSYFFFFFFFFFSSRRRHTRCLSDWSSDVCSSDLFALAGRLIVDVEFEGVRGISVKRDHLVGAGLFHPDGVIGPLAFFFPPDIELILRRINQIGVVEVREVLGVRDVGALFFTEVAYGFRRAGSAMLCEDAFGPSQHERRVVEFAAAAIHCVGVMIGDAFTAQVVERALHGSRNDLRARTMGLVLKRLALVAEGHGESAEYEKQGANHQDWTSQCTGSFHSSLLEVCWSVICWCRWKISTAISPGSIEWSVRAQSGAVSLTFCGVLVGFQRVTAIRLPLTKACEETLLL